MTPSIWSRKAPPAPNKASHDHVASIQGFQCRKRLSSEVTSMTDRHSTTRANWRTSTQQCGQTIRTTISMKQAMGEAFRLLCRRKRHKWFKTRSRLKSAGFTSTRAISSHLVRGARSLTSWSKRRSQTMFARRSRRLPTTLSRYSAGTWSSRASRTMMKCWTHSPMKAILWLIKRHKSSTKRKLPDTLQQNNYKSYHSKRRKSLLL